MRSRITTKWFCNESFKVVQCGQTESNLIIRNVPELGNEGLPLPTPSGRQCYSFVCSESERGNLFCTLCLSLLSSFLSLSNVEKNLFSQRQRWDDSFPVNSPPSSFVYSPLLPAQSSSSWSFLTKDLLVLKVIPVFAVPDYYHH